MPKNLQVLSPATFAESMQNFVQALGVADKGRYLAHGLFRLVRGNPTSACTNSTRGKVILCLFGSGSGHRPAP